MSILSPPISNHAFDAASPVVAQAVSTSKLRDSCHACAASKVKCHREKPSCSRCMKRGIPCRYVATRRGGRKLSTSTQNQGTGGDQTLSRRGEAISTSGPMQLWEMEDSASSEAPNVDFVQPGTPDHLPSLQMDVSYDLDFALFNNLGSTEEQALSPFLMDMTADFASSEVTFSVPETTEVDIFSAPSFSSSITAQGPSATLTTVGKDFASTTTAAPSHPGSTATTSSSEDQCPQKSHSKNSSHDSCLTRALELMKRLFQDEAATSGHSSPLTVKSILDNNKQVLRATNAMMKCSCSDDGYLLAIIAMIVSKALGWYDAAVRTALINISDCERPIRPPSSSSAPTSSNRNQHLATGSVVVSGYCLDGEDQERMKSQLVLGELHRVQSLVNQLSTKLRSLAAKKRGECPVNGDSPGIEKIPSISATVVDQVGTDLRIRLQWLSKHIIEGLNKE